jgi:hypothetical protein
MQKVFLMKKALQAFQTSLSPDQAVVQTDNARIMAYSRPPGGNTTPPPLTGRDHPQGDPLVYGS